MYHDGSRTCYSLAVENLLMIYVLKLYTYYRSSERARYIRILFLEITRILNHLLALQHMQWMLVH
jgi:NADH:ubiquinone oxidoreductase subunit D